mgnify:CR=1 FL=1
MKSFTRLYTALDASNKTNDKVAALRTAFELSQPEDILWLLAIILGKRTRKAISSVKMRVWAIEESGVPEWLFEESHALVGDVGETISLLVHGDESYAEEPLHEFMQEVEALSAMTEDEKHLWVLSHWRTMCVEDRFLFNKLLSGSLRVGVAKGLVLRALGEALGVDSATIAHRLMGNWTAQTLRYADLIAADDALQHNPRPYPFCLAFPLDVVPTTLGDISEWQAEWKWDGIRGQVIVRNGELFIWTRGEELVTDRYPELHSILHDGVVLDGVVLDGEILAYKDGAVQPFSEMQRRIGRKAVSKSMLKDVPVAFMAYDLLEHNSVDMRTQPLAARRALLETLIPQAGGAYMVSPVIHAPSWPELASMQADARSMRSEGLMLKRLDSPYQTGRKRGDWWKWKVEPYTVDAVLVYAQAGSGIRASLYTDYTFAIWKEGVLVPFAKAYSGLTNEEIIEVDAFVRKNTLEKFGPVRTVKPELVFELGFEGLQRSTRHKSGVAVRFPRILSRRTDKKPEDADTIETVLGLLGAHESHAK